MKELLPPQKSRNQTFQIFLLEIVKWRRTYHNNTMGMDWRLDFGNKLHVWMQFFMERHDQPKLGENGCQRKWTEWMGGVPMLQNEKALRGSRAFAKEPSSEPAEKEAD